MRHFYLVPELMAAFLPSDPKYWACCSGADSCQTFTESGGVAERDCQHRSVGPCVVIITRTQQRFLCPAAHAGLATYEAARHFADARAVTRLSAYMHHGQLSARLLMTETHRAGGKALSKTFSRRLIWRDLAYWQLALWPAMACQPMRPHYAGQVCCASPSLSLSRQRIPQPSAVRVSGGMGGPLCMSGTTCLHPACLLDAARSQPHILIIFSAYLPSTPLECG